MKSVIIDEETAPLWYVQAEGSVGMYLYRLGHVRDHYERLVSDVGVWFWTGTYYALIISLRTMPGYAPDWDAGFEVIARHVLKQKGYCPD